MDCEKGNNIESVTLLALKMKPNAIGHEKGDSVESNIEEISYKNFILHLMHFMYLCLSRT